MPYLSVIIPAYNSQLTIGPCLKAVRASGYKDYELIVVDDKSTDGTAGIAGSYADKVIELPEKKDIAHVRDAGTKASRGDIIVHIDSDVIVRSDTLSKIAGHFAAHADTDALTGLLSKEHPNHDFFSQYKNLYMNYAFKRLPEVVNFLYGSIHAVRRRAVQRFDPDIQQVGEDLVRAQGLVSSGGRIAFLRDLEVVHLKKYGFASFIKNDFQVPLHWARIFLKYGGWRQLFRRRTGFAHVPKEQLAGVLLAPAILLAVIASVFVENLVPALICLIFLWFLLNYRFIIFLAAEKGILFGIEAVFVTFIDHIVMAAGIAAGLITYRGRHAGG
jgi:glycosyltransferase involved in cell wall biosynthesis